MSGGLDRAGFMQVGRCGKSIVITSTMGSMQCTDDRGWAGFEVLSDQAVVDEVTGVRNSTVMDPLHYGTWIGGEIKRIKLSSQVRGQILAYYRILL